MNDLNQIMESCLLLLEMCECSWKGKRELQ